MFTMDSSELFGWDSVVKTLETILNYKHKILIVDHSDSITIDSQNIDRFNF